MRTATSAPIIAQPGSFSSPERPPASFFRRQPPRRRGRGHLHWSQLQALPPEDRGYHDGYHDRHYLPTLNYRRSQDWLAWFRGWQRGQAELKAERRAQGLLL